MAEPASAERFRRLTLHSRGSTSAIYLATDQELHRVVALKEIQDTAHDGAVARFLFEAEVTAGLEHPGIIPVYAIGRHPDGRPFCAMRFIEGQNFDDVIKAFHVTEGAERPVALRRLLVRFVAVCHAAAYAHAHGVVHRDIKPGNVLVGTHGETFLTQWAKAKRTDRTEDTAERQVITERLSGVKRELVGTLAYMPPEQARGELEKVGAVTDVFALGATLYHLLAGEPPYEAENNELLLEKVRRCEWKPVRQVAPSVPAALEAICKKAMAADPGARYRTATALSEDVERWLASVSTSDKTPLAVKKLVSPPTPPPPSRTPLLVALAAAVILGIGGLAVGRWGIPASPTPLTPDEANQRLAQALEAEKGLKQELASARQESSQAKNEVTAAQSEAKNARDALATAQGAESEAKEQLTAVRKSEKAARDELATLIKAAESGKGDSAAVTAARKAAQEAMDQLLAVRKTEQSLKDRLTEVSKSEQEAKTQLTAARKSEATAKEELTALRKSESEVKQKLTAALKAETDAKTQLAEARKSDKEGIGAARKAEQEAKDALAAIQKDIDKLKGELTAARKQETQAKEQLATAQKAEQQAKEALAKAEKGTSPARRTADELFTLAKTDPRLQRPSAEVIRKALLEKALALYTSLGAPKADDAAGAEMLLRLASLAAELGNKPEAMKRFEQARDAYAQLSKAQPAIAEHRAALADVHVQLAALQGQSDSAADAIKSLEQARDLYLGLREGNPKSTPARAGLIRVNDSLGQLLADAGKFDEALKHLDQARAVGIELTKQDDAPEHRVRLARTLHQIGNVQRDNKKPVEAQKAYEQGRDLRLQLVKAQPAVAEHQVDLATSYTSLGGLQSETDRGDDALKSYEQARDTLTQLVKGHPGVSDHQEALARACNRLGNAQRRARKFPEAVKSYEQAQDLFATLTRIAPDVVSYRADLAHTCNYLGFMYGNTARPDDALKCYTRARDVMLALSREQPEVTAHKSDLALFGNNLASRQRLMGKPQDALDTLTQSLPLVTALRKQEPDNTTFRQYLRQAHTIRALALGQLKKHQESVADWDEAIRQETDVGQQRTWRVNRAAALARAGDAGRSLEAVTELAKDDKLTGTQLVGLAQACSLTASAAAKEAGQEKSVESAVKQAVEALDRAYRSGHFKEAKVLATLKKEADFDFLRERAEFKRWLEGL